MEGSRNCARKRRSERTLEKPRTMEVRGRHLIEAMPRTVTVDDSEIRKSLIKECG